MEAISTIYFGNRKTNLILSSRCTKHLEVKQCASQVFPPHLFHILHMSQALVKSSTPPQHLSIFNRPPHEKLVPRQTPLLKLVFRWQRAIHVKKKKKQPKNRQHTEFSTLHVKKSKLDFTYINLEVQSLYYNSNTYCLDNRSYLYITSSNLEK